LTVNIQKRRINATLSEQAYQVLAENSTPRTISKFLSDLLVQFGNKRTINHRVTALEAKMEKFETLIDPVTRAKAEHWEIAEQRSREMAAGDYVTHEQFTKLLEQEGLSI